MIPRRMFFTKGIGYHRDRLISFELALRSAGVEICNLVMVSSIFPPDCKIISRTKGTAALHPGQVTFCVMARECTNEPNRLISAAIGLARPKNAHQYGYISEHHGFGHTAPKAADLVEDLAVTMLGSTLGVDVDVDHAWDENQQVYKVGANRQFISQSIAQSARGHKDGLFSTVVAMAIMLLD